MPSGLVFDGNPNAQAVRPVNRAECPANIEFFLFDGYLMGGGFSPCQSLQKSLDKTIPNHPNFVKSRVHQKRSKPRETIDSMGCAFDTNCDESNIVCSSDWFIART
jgi:hypothetical protein